jgi:phospholipid transport system substrate-binding protein
MDGVWPRFTRRGVVKVLLGAMAASRAGPVLAAKDPAEQYVTQIANEVMRLANSGTKGTALRGKFAAVLTRFVSLQNIANFALGPYQKKIGDKDRQQLYSLFSNYAAALFVYYVDDFQGTDLAIMGNSKQGNFTTISSAIVLKGGGREQVKWRLTPSGGGYRVSDINIKGVWLTLATKKRFNDVLGRSKGDFSALFAELKEADTW